ncbi:hypothetical protein K438DRAFT_1749823 [Mycena galopus ATCC 62051]|nr:hypothetical protein K438DRAFT_1749823 [Mycena galopus ATCC 62051]
MRWLFVFWSRRVDARHAAVRQEKLRATGDSVWKVEGVVTEDITGQPRVTAQRKCDAARDRSHASSVPFAMRIWLVSASHEFLGVVYAGIEAIAGPRIGVYAAIVANTRCAGRLTLCRASHVQHYRLRPLRWLGQRGGGSDGSGRYNMHEWPSLSCHKPSGLWCRCVLVFSAVWACGGRPESLCKSCKSTREVPCSLQPLPMRSSTQPRRRYSIAQTVTAQHGAAQGPCGAADLSERVPVASGRLHTCKSDVAPRKGFLRQKTASNPELSVAKN